MMNLTVSTRSRTLECTMTVQAPVSAMQSVPLADQFSCKDEALINDWHVVGFSKEVVPGKLIPVKLLGRDLVMWRVGAGNAHFWVDLFIHRGGRLSNGGLKKRTWICPHYG